MTDDDWKEAIQRALASEQARQDEINERFDFLMLSLSLVHPVNQN